MKKIKSLTYMALLLMVLTGVSHAQNKKLIFSNGQQTDIQGNATIDINTGDITVQTIGNKLIVDEPPSQKAIIGFYPSEYAINPNDTIDVNWAVAYTDGTNCSASVTQGAALWSGNKNAAPGAYVQPNVTVTQLPTTLRLTCNNYNTGSSYQEFQLVQKSGGNTTPTTPTINTFQLSQYPGSNPTIPNDGNYTIQWSVSNLTGSCTATSTAFNNGGWTGTRGSSGSESIFIEDEPVLRLTCTNSGGSPVQRAITIDNASSGGGGTPANCAQVDIWKPPSLTATVWDYTDTYTAGKRATPGVNGFGAPFYHPDNTTKQMINHINPEVNFITIENVQVPNQDLDIKFSFTTSPGWGEQGPTTFSISECPGNFNPATARCVAQIVGNNVLLSTRSAVANSFWGNQPNFCHLEKGKKYYINFVFSQPYDGTNFNNVLQGPGEECNSAISNGCAIFWGEKAWDPF
ncbi:hypothetical protein GCM10011365_11690 [Marinicella pacifica]|uniref:Uncharacterized protein n=1 Tax=Marinicella pacifica TaxID=1171543 RepID=A0A917CNH3_9GAMM|nr:hypothetical protein [Marinicella pacifica]GGF92129.1 hypothetical protein GCM10011365_11690 [Marinicella pacifica]